MAPAHSLSLYLDILAPYVDILRWSSFSTAPENPWSQMQLFNAKLRSSITIGLKLIQTEDKGVVAEKKVDSYTLTVLRLVIS